MTELRYKILLLEDSAEDVELVARSLAETDIPFDLESADTESSFIEALHSFRPDIVIADYMLPGYDGLTALSTVREFSPYTPFIICTGSINEEVAVDCMKAGADDYVLKDRIIRLGPAVKTALEKARMLKDKHETENALRESEAKLRLLIDNITDLIVKVDAEGRFLYVSPSYCELFGKNEDELIGKHFMPLVHEDDRESTGRAMLALHKPPYTCYIEQRAMTKYGWRWLAWTDRAIVNGTGQIEAIIGAGKDITERYKTELALAQSHDFYLTLFEKIPGMIWRADEKGEVNYVNQSLVQFTGRLFEEELGRKWLELVHPDDRAMAEKTHFENILAKKPFQMEYRILHKDGEYRWIIDTGRPYEDIGGNHAGYLGMCYDIHERRMAEERILHVNRLYSVLSHINQAIVEIKNEEILLDRVCHVAVELGEFKMAWIGMHDAESGTLKPVAQYGDSGGYLDKVPLTLDGNKDKPLPIHSVLNTGRPYVINSITNEPHIDLYKEIAGKSGFKSAGIFPVKSDDRVTGVLFIYAGEEDYFRHEEIQLFEEVVEDISFALKNIADEKKRVEAEKSLQESEERFRTLVQSMDDIVFVLDLNQRHVGVYGRWLENFDIHEDMILGKTPRDIPGFGSAKVHEDASNRALAGEHVLYNWEIETHEGTRYMQTSLSPLRDAGGAITGAVGVGRDITELREAQSIQRIQSAAVESAANAIIITDTNGIIQSVNTAFTTLTGYEQEEVIGKKTSILRSGKHEESFYSGLWETIRSGQVWSGEVINKRKDGSLYTEEMTITPVRDPSGTISHFIAIKQDVTQQKKLQHHIVQAQKMESVGKLASGIAHDFNNILGIIIGYAGLLEKSRYDGEKFEKNVQAINKAVKRGANLVQQILTFARKTDVTLEIVRVNTIITELVPMLEETFPKTIALDLVLGKNIPHALIDQGQLHQALLNLCVNARDAIQASGEDSGTITIKTRVVSGAHLRVKYPEAKPGKYIEISVNDTGTGMDEETVERIFEPFFTTKDQGKGTGLGLSVVYGIVKSYQGFIEVQTEKSIGTTFSLYLPVRLSPANDNEPEILKIDNIPGGRETILFIEDESMLREAVVTILRDKGYDVICAVDGPAGIETYSNHRDTIDIVVSDIGLPGLSGTQVFERIKTLNPDVPYILASGFFDPATKKQMAGNGVDAFIRKPYQPDEILLTIRKVLDD